MVKKENQYDFETKTYEFSFNVRNKSGGVYPTHTNGDYFKELMANVTQLKHLEHLEDEMLNYGVEGCKSCCWF